LSKLASYDNTKKLKEKNFWAKDKKFTELAPLPRSSV
jgi:hypothetical protein